MIIYLYGPDSYNRNCKLRALVGQYRGKHKETDIFAVDLEENPESWVKLRDFLEQPSMFVASKLAIVRGTNEAPEKSEKEWIKVLKKELESKTTFVVAVDRGKPRKSFSFLLEPPVRTFDFPELEGPALAEFVKQECVARGVVLEPGTARFLADAAKGTEDRGWMVANVLRSIELAGFPSPVSVRDAGVVMRAVPKAELFPLARGIMHARSAPESLLFLERALHAEDAAYIFNMAGTLARGSALLDMASYDVGVKSGRWEYEEALTDLALGGERLAGEE